MGKLVENRQGFAPTREDDTFVGWTMCVGQTSTGTHNPSPAIASRSVMLAAVSAAGTSEGAFRAALPSEVDDWFMGLTSTQRTQVRLAASVY